MEEVIVEYIFDTCKLIGSFSVSYNGKEVFYDVLKKHIGDLFNIGGWEVDGYLITCFYEMDVDFDYAGFMCIVKPKPYSVEIVNNRFCQYYFGIDPSACDSITITSVCAP